MMQNWCFEMFNVDPCRMDPLIKGNACSLVVEQVPGSWASAGGWAAHSLGMGATPRRLRAEASHQLKGGSFDIWTIGVSVWKLAEYRSVLNIFSVNLVNSYFRIFPHPWNFKLLKTLKIHKSWKIVPWTPEYPHFITNTVLLALSVQMVALWATWKYITDISPLNTSACIVQE